MKSPSGLTDTRRGIAWVLTLTALACVGSACGRARGVPPSASSSSGALNSGDLAVTSIGYRGDGMVSSRSLAVGATVLLSQTHLASPGGISTDENRIGSAVPEQHFKADSLGRLQCVTTDAGSTCPGNATSALPAGVRALALYSGDKLTNLRRRVDGGIANTRLEYDSFIGVYLNRPARIVVSTADCATSACETSFALAYDVRGNRTTETPGSGQGAGAVSRRFTYGPDNRLRTIRAALPAAPAADCSPTRWDQIDTDVGYDQLGVIAFRRRRLGTATQQTVRYSRNPSGEIGYSLQAGATATQRVTYKYLHLAGERTVAVRETWDGSQRTSRTYLFLHSDRNGAPIAAFGTDHPDSTGTQQWTAERDPWGWTKITSAFPADEVPFEYPGQLRLDGTEVKRLVAGTSGCETQTIQPAILSNGFRDYDPIAGVYLSRDPIAPAGTEWATSSANRNLYAYAGFNPIDRTDYWGLRTPGFLESLIPIWGPLQLMGDDIEHGRWASATMNASFFLLDLASFGTAAAVRDVAVSGGRGVAEAEARALERWTCDGATRGGEQIAEGAHTVFRREAGNAGRVSHYETRIPQTNPRNPAPWESAKRFDATGKGHFNKATQERVPTPHVHDPAAPGGVRVPSPDEIPFGWP